MQSRKENTSIDRNSEIQFVCVHFTTNEHGFRSPILENHYHNYIEIIYVIKGHGVAIINNTEHSLTNDCFIIIPPNVDHTAFYSQFTEYVVIIFPPDMLYSHNHPYFEIKHLNKFFDSKNEENIFKASDILTADIKSLILEICSENEKKSYFYEMIIRSNLLKFIFSVMRYSHSKKQNTNNEEHLPEAIANLIPYIAENYDTVTAADAANKLGISYNYFSHLFKKHMHISFVEYLTKVRLTEAKKQLLLTQKSITEIAINIGFSTTSHFIMLFKKSTGITPQKFRNTYYTQ